MPALLIFAICRIFILSLLCYPSSFLSRILAALIVSDNPSTDFSSTEHQTKTKNTMNNTLHTPAPWQVSPLGNVMKNSLKIAIVEQMPSNDENERMANARLIAAAPDLLSALEFLLADYIAINGEKVTGSSVPADKARAALRKAKGEA
jgi:hypothetical protein